MATLGAVPLNEVPRGVPCVAADEAEEDDDAEEGEIVVVDVEDTFALERDDALALAPTDRLLDVDVDVDDAVLEELVLLFEELVLLLTDRELEVSADRSPLWRLEVEVEVVEEEEEEDEVEADAAVSASAPAPVPVPVPAAASTASACLHNSTATSFSASARQASRSRRYEAEGGWAAAASLLALKDVDDDDEEALLTRASRARTPREGPVVPLARIEADAFACCKARSAFWLAS